MPIPLLPLLTPLALSIAGFMGFRNTNKTTSTSKEIAEQQQSNQLKLAYLNIQAQKDLEENRQRLQVDLERSRQQFQERMSYFGFKQQLTLREFDQQFQLRVRELDHRHQQEIEEFRAKVSVAINQKNLDFQAWKFEQEMTLQQEIALFNRETQLAIATYQRETALQQPEINKIYENWPLKLLPTQILNSHPNHLRIFISPPELDYDRFINLTDPKSHSFPRVESFLGTRLLKLLNQHYPRNDALRPTQLLDEAWDSKRFAGSSSIVALADRLESEPLVVLETRVSLNKYLSLRVAYKGVGQKNYFYDEVIPRFEYGDILLAAAKARIGETVPVDTQKIQVTPDDWEVLYEMLEVAHCVVAAWIADVHHLIYYNASPLLPQLLPGIVKELPSFLLTDTSSALIPLMQEVVKGYQAVFQQLEKTERRYQVPDLFLDLARGVMSLEDKSLSKKLAEESVQSWLRLRGIPNKMDSLSKVATKNDLSFLRQVLKICQSVGNIEMSIKLDKLIVRVLSRELQILKSLFQDRPEVLRMLDLRELDFSELEGQQRKRRFFPEPVNLYATGRTRAGKSSLGNSLFGRTVFLTTGHLDCTKTVQFFRMAGNLRYFDLPGAGSSEQSENINRAALLVPQLDDPDEDMIPVTELDIFDFSQNQQGEPVLEKLTVKHWQSPENQNFVAPDVILYVIAPHEGVGRDDRRYLTALLKSQKESGNKNKVIFALNIHRNTDRTMKATPQNIEYAKKLITEAYQKLYSGTPPIVEINALKGTGVNQITEFMCKFLPLHKISNMQQVLQDELKQFAEKERSRRYRQTLVYIASRLATYTVDTQLGNQNLLQEAYAAVCNYGVMIFRQQEVLAKAEKEFYNLVGNVAAQAKISREEAIKVVEQITEEKELKQTIVTQKPKFEEKEVEETHTIYVENTESRQESYTHGDDVGGGAFFGAGVGTAVAAVASFFIPIAAPIFLGAAALGAAGGAAAGTGRRTKTVTENVMKPAKNVVKRMQRDLVGFDEEKQEIVTGTYQAVVGQRENVVGKKAKQGGYPVVEDLLAIGLGLELANPSIDLQKKFPTVVENGRKQVQAKLVRYKDQINQLAESGNPDKAEQEIIGILKRVLEN
jgi:predicted GTPase